MSDATLTIQNDGCRVIDYTTGTYPKIDAHQTASLYVKECRATLTDSEGTRDVYVLAQHLWRTGKEPIVASAHDASLLRQTGQVSEDTIRQMQQAQPAVDVFCSATVIDHFPGWQRRDDALRTHELLARAAEYQRGVTYIPMTIDNGVVNPRFIELTQLSGWKILLGLAGATTYNVSQHPGCPHTSYPAAPFTIVMEPAPAAE